MRFWVSRMEMLVLAACTGIGFLLFPLGFIWFYRKADRLPWHITLGAFFTISIHATAVLIYLTYPDFKGWYYAILTGGLFTALLLISRSRLSSQSAIWRVKASYFIGAGFVSLALCGLYYMRTRLL